MEHIEIDKDGVFMNDDIFNTLSIRKSDYGIIVSMQDEVGYENEIILDDTAVDVLRRFLNTVKL